MKFNWDQSGMPVSLVSSLGKQSEPSEFGSVVCELTTALARVKRELEEVRRENERLTDELAHRDTPRDAAPPDPPAPESPRPTPADAAAEWEEWNRRFQSLLDG